MTFTGNKKEAKSFVSALRRELKKLNKPTSELSHNECLMVAAIALGHSSWNQWEAKLPDAPSDATPQPPKAKKYPLVNDGSFDLVAGGEPGIPCRGIGFEPVKGTSDIVLCTAPVSTAERWAGEILPDYDDETDVCWDSQEVQKAEDGSSLWCTQSSGDVSERSLVLVPFDQYQDPLPQDEWPVRSALVNAFLEYAKEENAPAKGDDEAFLERATATVGFELSENERAEFLARLRGNGQQPEGLRKRHP